MPKSKSSRKRKSYKYRKQRGWGGDGKYYRSRQKGPLRMLRTLPVGGVPKVSYKKLRHCQEILLDPSVGSYAKFDFFPTRINQLTIATGQGIVRPNNFEAVANGIYRKAVVVGAKITFRVFPSTSQTSDFNASGGYVGIYVSNASDVTLLDDIFQSGGVTDIMEQPRNTTMKGMPNSNTPQKDCVVSRSIDCGKFWGIGTKNYEDSDAYAAEWDASNEEWLSPSDHIAAQVFCASIQNNNPGKCAGVVTIDLIVKFSQPHYTG